MVFCRARIIIRLFTSAIWPCMKTSLCCYGGQQVKSNQHLDICLVSTLESKWEGPEREAISMLQPACCISAVLMWWSRPEQRQTALSSSPPLCTVVGPVTYHAGWGATDVRASCVLCLQFPRRWWCCRVPCLDDTPSWSRERRAHVLFVKRVLTYDSSLLYIQGLLWVVQ